MASSPYPTHFTHASWWRGHAHNTYILIGQMDGLLAGDNMPLVNAVLKGDLPSETSTSFLSPSLSLLIHFAIDSLCLFNSGQD